MVVRLMILMFLIDVQNVNLIVSYLHYKLNVYKHKLKIVDYLKQLIIVQNVMKVILY